MKPPLSAAIRCFAVAAALVLAACETPDPTPRYPEITFTHKAPIRLDVHDIDYVQAYIPPSKLPNVEHLFPVRPAVVARRWAADRVVAVGLQGVARVTLVEAAVIESALETTSGLQGAFIEDQAARYDATVKIRIEIINSLGETEGRVEAVAKRSRTVPEGITLVEREQIWFELTEQVMRELDVELEHTIDRYFGDYIR
ncbi:MAG: hypothetical protein VCB77_02845 [Alphaproteobacteria bacterium]